MKVKFSAFITDASTGSRLRGGGEATVPDYVDPADAGQYVEQRLADQGHKDPTVTITSPNS